MTALCLALLGVSSLLLFAATATYIAAGRREREAERLWRVSMRALDEAQDLHGEAYFSLSEANRKSRGGA